MNTIYWRINNLIHNGKLMRVGRGKYKIGKSVKFLPNLSKKELTIGKKIKKALPYLEYCIWKSDLINQFSLHQSPNNFIIVETERSSLDAVFQILKENYKNVFLKPSQYIVENHLLDMEQVIVVQHLVSETPIQKTHKTPTITLEKLLVDLIHGKDLFYYYQGYELKNIFQNAFDKYTINESTLLRYAGRRKKKQEVLRIIKTIKRH